MQAGRVAVVWRLDRLDGSEQVSLAWWETNGPAVNPPSQKGIGHFVTDSMIARSLNGYVTVDYMPHGLRWKIAFSASNIAKRAPSPTRG